MNKRASARNRTSDIIVDVDVDVLSLCINAQEVCRLSRDEAKMLVAVINRSPEFVPYDELKAKVLEQTIGDVDLFLRKKLSALRKKLGAVKCEVISTIRGEGLRLANFWERISPANRNDYEERDSCCIQLDRLVERVITIAQESPMKEVTSVKSGDITLMLDGGGVEAALQEIYEQFVNISRTVVMVLGEDQAVAPVVRTLRVLESYILFQRSGVGIPEARWKELFALECKHYATMVREFACGKS